MDSTGRDRSDCDCGSCKTPCLIEIDSPELYSALFSALFSDCRTGGKILNVPERGFCYVLILGNGALWIEHIIGKNVLTPETFSLLCQYAKIVHCDRIECFVNRRGLTKTHTKLGFQTNYVAPDGWYMGKMI